MSNLNPFVPKGSLLEQQSQSRSRLKLAVFCVVAVGTLGLVAMLIQGCKRDTGTDSGTMPTIETNQPTITDTNINPPITDYSNQPPTTLSNAAVNPLPPLIPGSGTTTTTTTVPPVGNTDVAPVGGTEYIVVAGDSLSKIATKNHVSLKALEAANPGVDSKHLKIKQHLVIPAGGSSTVATPVSSDSATSSVETTSAVTTYTVKSGDNLLKLSKKFGVSQKAIQAANHLTTTRINVGQKLKIPAKTAKAVKVTKPTAPVADVAPAVPVDTMAPPALPVTTAPPTIPASH